MYKKYPTSFEWPIKASILQQRMLVVAHALAAVALLISAIAPVYKAVLILSVVIGGLCYWRVYGQPNETVTIRYTDAFGWELSVNNEYRSISIIESTVVTSWVIVLHYQLENKNRHWAIFNDALSKEDFIRLIVQLKIAGLREP